MNRDDLIANLNLSVNLTSTNFGKQIAILQKLQPLLQHYQALKRYEEKLEENLLENILFSNTIIVNNESQGDSA